MRVIWDVDKLIPYVEGGFKAVYCDPPWYEYGAGAKYVRGAQAHYPLLKTGEIIYYLS